TPKIPRKLPGVPSEEQTNRLVDGVASNQLKRAYPQRDLLIFELLYGCGLRVSELVGLNLNDIDRNEQLILVRGKGNEQRIGPYGRNAATSLVSYRSTPQSVPEKALILNHRGGRQTDRGAHGIVSLYARMLEGDGSIHPH